MKGECREINRTNFVKLEVDLEEVVVFQIMLTGAHRWGSFKCFSMFREEISENIYEGFPKVVVNIVIEKWKMLETNLKSYCSSNSSPPHSTISTASCSILVLCRLSRYPDDNHDERTHDISEFMSVDFLSKPSATH